MKLLRVHLLCALLALLPATVQARTLPALEGLEKLRQCFATTQDFTAELTQEKQLSVLRKKLVMKGTIRFKKPDRFLLVMAPPYSGTTLLKDNLLEQRLGQGGELQRVVLPPDQGLRHWFSLLDKPLTRLPDGLKVRAELQRGLYTVVVLPEGQGQMREITIQFQEDGTMRRLVLEERNGDKTVMQFKNLRKNTGLHETDFRIN